MHAVELEVYSPENQTEWDAFVRTANDGTLFHLRTFLNYHPEGRFLDNSLLFRKRGRLLAVLPAARRHGDPAKELVSHPGASFGGLVSVPDLSLKDSTRIVRLLVDHAKERHYGAIDLTLAPHVYQERPSHHFDFALLKAGFEYRKRELSSLVRLDRDPERLLAGFRPEARRAVRRAEKLGVRVVRSDALPRFYAILEKNLKMRHNVIPTHTLQELQLLMRLFPGEIVLFAAYAGRKMASGVVLFRANPRAMLAFYISHDEAMQSFRSLNILFLEVFKWCAAQGAAWLDFGLFTVNMAPNWGLGRFKESFGAQAVFRDSLRLPLL